MNTWATGISALTLFVEDLPSAKAFYRDVLGLRQIFEDDVSVAFAFGTLVVNVLAVEAADELIAPGAIAAPEAGTRYQLTIEVDDVDAVCHELADKGVPLLNGPMNRPWGLRTACFPDPAGHIWEIAQNLPADPLTTPPA
jgi:catechol 2,3-dioxygenase-like lactoylglutathione lyase family enzyme